MFYYSRKSPSPSSPSNLTLEQKQKMIKDSENLQRLQGQTQLVGNSYSGPTTGPANQHQAKDLTESLMATNLNRFVAPRLETLEALEQLEPIKSLHILQCPRVSYSTPTIKSITLFP